MAKFHVGDRVRLTQAGYDEAIRCGWFGCERATVGMLGVVKRDDCYSQWGPYEVKFNNEIPWYMNEDFIEAVDVTTPTPVRRIIVVEVDDFHFERSSDDDKIDVFIDGEAYGEFSIDQFREIVKALEA